MEATQAGSGAENRELHPQFSLPQMHRVCPNFPGPSQRPDRTVSLHAATAPCSRARLARKSESGTAATGDGRRDRNRRRAARIGFWVNTVFLSLSVFRVTHEGLVGFVFGRDSLLNLRTRGGGLFYDCLGLP